MLKAVNLSYSRGRRPIIRSANLSLVASSLHTVVGLNGSGKTTLLKTMAGIWPALSGDVLLRDEVINLWDRRRISRTITLVPQSPSIAFNYRVSEIVEMGYYPLADAQRTITIDEALNRVNALHLKERSILQVSAGEQQRVYIARALATQAPIIFLDEPTANLDIKHQIELWKLLIELTEQGHLLLVATHDLAAARRYSNTVALMQNGRIVQHGRPDNVLSVSQIEEFFGVRSNNELQLPFALASHPQDNSYSSYS